MPIPKTELTVDFGPIAPDAPEDTPVPFTVRNEGTSESWPGGQFRCPLDTQALADVRWYLEEYWRWPFGAFRDRAHGIEAQLEGYGRAFFDALFYAREPARIYEHFLNQPADVRTLTIVSDAPRVMRLPWELLAESTGPLFTKRPPISIRRRVRLVHAPAGAPLRAAAAGALRERAAGGSGLCGPALRGPGPARRAGEARQRSGGALSTPAHAGRPRRRAAASGRRPGPPLPHRPL